ncbi:uncharacterized protein N7518_008892 [Penicillium psychrosexuale]|uniref:uncharacterized protein n=1 Tax=Penicillium psychrosexuale TaxID=1002107 RepID=UPI002544EB26|nr:uncharacterized protein N7518_008892 [Penicillium psychrosexuale]KAJ5791881.1 hypothetical protein N7518_008892 [Penicillium psychrosexuale]
MESLTVLQSWIPSGLDEGDRITLDKPSPSEWVVGKLVNKHTYQSDLMRVHSYVCIQFECHNATNEKHGFMRVYVQVPHVGYEHADQATRAREATKFTPPELDAYKFLTQYASQNTPHLLAYEEGTQDTGGPVPGGHITWIVWEKVPGKSLGGPRYASTFWDMDREERDRVREAFLEQFPKLMKMGYFPDGAGPSNLVWDKETGALYFVSFRDSKPFKAKGTFGKEWWPEFDLAKPPQRHYQWEIHYNGDVSAWTL